MASSHIYYILWQFCEVLHVLTEVIEVTDFTSEGLNDLLQVAPQAIDQA
jgi:hypothetical protein